MLRLNATPHDVERRLADRTIACPRCGTGLRPWGHDRSRQFRVGLTDRQTIRTIRRRRARCPACQTTHVIQDPRLAWRRRDTLRVIHHALKLKRARHGYRKTAEQIDRPDSTVRNWYRRHRTHPNWPDQ